MDILLWRHTKIQWVAVSKKLAAMWNLKPCQWDFYTYLKKYQSTLHFEWVIDPHTICNTSPWSFERHRFSDLCGTWECWPSLYNIRKSHSLVWLPISLGKSYVLEIFHARSGKCKFSKVLISTWKQEVYHRQKKKKRQFFPWSDRLVYFIFEKNVCNTQAWITTAFCQ